MSQQIEEIKIDPNEIKTRDPYILMIISGATKASTHKDMKKENNKYECRRKVNRDDWNS